MARAKQRVATSVGIGVLFALSIVAVLFAFLFLFFALLFGGLDPDLLADAIRVMVVCIGGATTCVFLIRYLAVRETRRSDSN